MNTQPWAVYVARTRTLGLISARALDAFSTLTGNRLLEDQFLGRLDSLDRQWLRGVLDARRRGQPGSKAPALANRSGEIQAPLAAIDAQEYFRFFDASTALIFTIGKSLGRGSILDYGMFLQNVHLAARSRNVETRKQTAWKGFEDIVIEAIGASGDETLVCVLPLGHNDPQRRPPELVVAPPPVEKFTTFLGAC